MVDMTAGTGRIAAAETRQRRGVSDGDGSDDRPLGGSTNDVSDGAVVDTRSALLGGDELARIAILYGSRRRSGADGDGRTGEGGSVRTSDASPESDAATSEVRSRLGTLAADHDGFHEVMRRTYGDAYDYAAAERIRQQTLAGDFSWMPRVEVVDASALSDRSGTMPGGLTAGAAYAAETDTIYISRELLEGDPERAADVLLEEIGHALDQRVGAVDANGERVDTQGDEGEVFALLVADPTRGDDELAAARAENDTGVVVIDGREVEVEFSGGVIGDFVGGVLGAIGGVFKSVFDAFISPFKALVEITIDTISAVWDAIKDVIEKILMSAWFSKILFVLQFVPIPIVQVIVRVIQVIKAAYMVYQGIKHGSMAMVLGGLAGMAAGIGQAGALLGASQKFVDTMANIATRLNQAAAFYRAAAARDFGAALEIASAAFDGTPTGDVIDTVARGHAVAEAWKRGDVLGAIGLGADLLQDIPGDHGDEFLAKVSNYTDVVASVVDAVVKGDYSTAASLLTENFGDDVGLSEEAQAHIVKVATSFEQLAAAKEALESGDLSGAVDLVFGVAAEHAPNERTAADFREAGEVLGGIATALELAAAGEYTEAVAALGEFADGVIDDPALATLLADVERWVGGFERIAEALEGDDHVAAVEALLDLAELDVDPLTRSAIGTLDDVRDELLQLEAAIDDGNWLRAWSEAKELAAAVRDPAVAAALERLAELLLGRADEPLDVPPANAPATAYA